MPVQLDITRDMAVLPLIRLNTVLPFVRALEVGGISAEPVFERTGLTREALANEETFVHAMVMYQFLEELANEAGDVRFCAKIGEKLDITKWVSFDKGGTVINTLGSLLTAAAIVATEHSSSTQHQLEIHGANAVFAGLRTFETPFVPAQIDAFFATLMASLVRRAIGQHWEPKKVLLTVSDPEALLPIFYGIRALKGDRRGYRIRFPALWLNEPFDVPEFVRKTERETSASSPGASISSAVQQTLEPHIRDPELSVKKVAELCGMSRRSLARLLAVEDQTIHSLMESIKCNMATNMLKQDDLGIAEIALLVGYTDPTSFTRSFRRWTGQSPRAFRREVQKDIT